LVPLMDPFLLQADMTVLRWVAGKRGYNADGLVTLVISAEAETPARAICLAFLEGGEK